MEFIRYFINTDSINSEIPCILCEIYKIYDFLDTKKCDQIQNTEIIKGFNLIFGENYLNFLDSKILLKILDCENDKKISKSIFCKFMRLQALYANYEYSDLLENLEKYLLKYDIEKKLSYEKEEFIELIKNYLGNLIDLIINSICEFIGKKRIYISEFIYLLLNNKEDLVNTKIFNVTLFLQNKVSIMEYYPLAKSILLSEHNKLISHFFTPQFELAGIDYSKILSKKPFLLDKPCENENDNKKPLKVCSGQLILHSAKINKHIDFTKTQPESEYKVAISFYDNLTKIILPGTVVVNCTRNENQFEFNKTDEIGTNPIIFKYDTINSENIEIMLELIISLNKTKFLSLGLASINIAKLQNLHDYLIPFLENTGKSQDLENSHISIGIRPFSYLSGKEQLFIELLPEKCLLYKRLLLFTAIFQDYLRENYKNDLDSVVCEFHRITENYEFTEFLIHKWHSI